MGCFFRLVWPLAASVMASGILGRVDARFGTNHHQQVPSSDNNNIPAVVVARDLDQAGGLECFDSLIFSDVNFDRKVNKTEYITFLELFGPSNFLPGDVQEFEDLALILQSNFLILACLCQQQPGADPNCCIGDAAHISNMGAAPDETPTPQEETYLSQVCFLSEASINKYAETIVPTPPPIATPAPIVIPTLAPTAAPVTPAPTVATPAPIVPPTLSPTLSPTRVTTLTPTRGPTFPPSPSPTIMGTPTLTTLAPTSAAPAVASGVPTTVAPTGTMGPTIPPAIEPTSIAPSTPPASIVPSLMPVPLSEGPSALPTSSLAPSAFPSAAPTAGPTITPMPSRGPVDATAASTYVIAKRIEATIDEYVPGLIAAMDLLAPKVAAGLNLTALDSGERRLRGLQVTGVEVFLPTAIDQIVVDTICPSGVPSSDSCEDITAFIGLYVDGGNASLVREAFENDLGAAIEDGELQTFLEQVDPDSPVYIAGFAADDDDFDKVIPPDPNDDGGLSGGAISGIVIGGMATILLTAGLLSRQARQNRNSQDEEYELEDRLKLEEMEEMNALETPQSKNPGSGSGKASYMGGATLATGAVATAMVASSRDPRERQDSDAGSSGWSSREGMSSVDEDSKASLPSAAGVGLMSGDYQEDDPNIDSTNSSYSDSGLQLTYSELDHAIQKGDWAAVGVTAALLASQSHGDASKETPEKKVNFEGDMNPDRAAELDRLVEAGDWAGVVAAAAKYDAQEAAQSTASEAGTSDAGGSSAMSVASTRTGDSGYSGSGTALTGASGGYTAGTTGSESGSRARKVEEIRAEVEALVEKVVPEEKDNIDEMMLQFRGREEELVETLRSMQEREVAQKARVEGQKRAKRDARQTAEQRKLESTAIATPGDTATDDNWIEEIDNTPAEPDVHLIDTSAADAPMSLDDEEADEMIEDDDDLPRAAIPAAVAAAGVGAAVVGSTSSNRTVTPPPTDPEPAPAPKEAPPQNMEDLQEALKRAIDAEDWEKVAETAAGLSGKFNYDSEDDDDTEHDASTKSTDKSQRINELVDKGDWDGVVAAASQFADEDYRSLSTGSDSKDIEERRARRAQRLKEEQEALEQADIWAAIADQTRQSTLDRAESEANQAATVAADWAIARSLSELKAADQAGRLSDRGSSSDDDDENKEV